MNKQPSRMQGLGQGLGKLGSGGRGSAFSVLPLPAALTCATLIGGIREPPEGIVI